MFVGRKDQLDLSGTLTVDNWSSNYVKNENNQNLELIESYEGKVNMEKVNEWKYLGFVISNQPNNLSNIRSIKIKSIGIVKTIFNRLASLNLQKYYFECGILFKM